MVLNLRKFKQENIIILLLITIGIFYFFSLDNRLPGDSKVSVILAESLSQGKGLKDISDIREPLVSFTAPLFPGLLSFLVKFVTEIKMLKIFSVFIVLSSLWVIYLLLKQYIKPPKVRIFLFLLILVNPFMYRIVNEITTHALFLLLAMINVYFMSLYEKSCSKKYLSLIALFSGLSFLTRWVGISFFIGIFFYLVIKKRVKHLLLFTILFSIIAGPWIYYTFYLHFSGQAAFLYLTIILSQGDNKLEPLIKMLSFSMRFVRNLGGYFFRNIPVFVFGDFFEGVTLVNFRVVTVLKMVIAFFPSAIIFYGFLKELRFKSVYFCIIIYGIILGMFAEPDIHYIVPLLAFFYIWGYKGLVSLKANKKILMGVFLFIFSINVLTLGIRLFQREQDSSNVTRWIINNTENKDVFLGYKWFDPLYIYTGRKFVHLFSYEDLFKSAKYVYKNPEKIIEKNIEIKYVLVYFQRTEKQFLKVKKMVLNNPNKFNRRYTDPNQTTSIYEIIR